MHETKAKKFSFKVNKKVAAILVIAVASALSQIFHKSGIKFVIEFETLEKLSENEDTRTSFDDLNDEKLFELNDEITSEMIMNSTESEAENMADFEFENPFKTKFCFHHNQNDLQIFQSIHRVLESLNLEWIPINSTSHETMHYDWDLLWSYEHFCEIPLDWSLIQFNKKVNHIPGSFHLTSKSVFGSTTQSKYVPKAFLNVEDVKNYSKQHPEKRFVTKFKSNRGVKLQSVNEMNFTDSNSQNDYFAMEFIENPLLFNGHKFDFAVYVVITSINPLRIYLYNKNIIMRFCPDTYDASNAEERDRYVVHSSHIPGSKFPGVQEFFKADYTYKEAFNAFLRRKGVDEEKVWKDVEDLIRSIIVSKEKFFIDEVSEKVRHHFRIVLLFG
jgi:Tubulin-tyrosine ligase family